MDFFTFLTCTNGTRSRKPLQMICSFEFIKTGVRKLAHINIHTGARTARKTFKLVK